VGAVLFALSAGLAAQGQQSGSLADAARQMRAQKQGQASAETSQAQQVADQLSEDQNDKDAPGGFKIYQAEAYKLLVPAPYLSGHDDAGTVLSGPQTGSTRLIVMAGTPVVLRSDVSDDAFRDAAIQFARGYAQSATCTKTALGSYNAYQCGLAGANLGGHTVSGNAMFVQSSNNMFPVFCVASTDSRARDLFNDPHSTFRQKQSARQVMDREDQDVRNAWKSCDTVFGSIRAMASASPKSEKAEATASPMHAAPPVPEQTVPLAAASEPAPSSVPAGFKVQHFNYCKRVTDCWDASVLVPEAAQLISSDCKQYVFEMKVHGAPFLLLAGAGGSDCADSSKGGASQVRWHELAEPESRRDPGTYATIGTIQTALDGKPAVITQFGFRKGLDSWTGKRAELESNGVALVVGCMAPRDHFADGDSVCSGLMESLRLP
jgi:hypothetical protein